MKIIVIIAVIFELFFTNELLAQNSNKKQYNAQNIIGLSYRTAQYDNKPIGYIELRDQICYEINDFPVIPFFEPNINFGLTNQKPNFFITALFGLKKNIINRHNWILSIDFGVGIASNFKAKDYEGIISSIGFDIDYKNIVLRCCEFSYVTGFTFKGTVSFGLNYAF